MPYEPSVSCAACSAGVDPLRAPAVIMLDRGLRYFCSRECQAGYRSADASRPLSVRPMMLDSALGDRGEELVQILLHEPLRAPVRRPCWRPLDRLAAGAGAARRRRRALRCLAPRARARAPRCCSWLLRAAGSRCRRACSAARSGVVGLAGCAARRRAAGAGGPAVAPRGRVPAGGGRARRARHLGARVPGSARRRSPSIGSIAELRSRVPLRRAR